MIPSKGLRWSSQTIGIGRRRLEIVPTRHFSSNVHAQSRRAAPLLSGKTASFPKTFHFPRSNGIIRNGAAVRFASSVPAGAAAAVNSSSNPSPAEAVQSIAASPASSHTELTSSLDSVMDLTSESLYDVPESIGYLKSLGLEYGYGPTAMMEWTLEHIHVFAGTPWWVSIGLTAFLTRAVLFKAYIGAADNGAKMASIKHITKPITEKMTAAQRAGDMDAVLRLRQELQQINRRAGIVLWKSFVPMGQAVAGFGTFMILRAMARLPVPGLETGGALWFYNLTIPDPYFILPIATAGTLHWVLRRGGETGQSSISPKVLNAMMYGLPAVSLIFTSWLPAAVQMSFFISGLLSWAQASLFKISRFREYFNMVPLPPPEVTTKKPASAPSPYKGKLKLAPTAPQKPSPALSTSELDSRFEPGSARDAAATQTSPMKRMMAALKTPFDGVKESGKAAFDQANEYMDSKREKSVKADAARYEKKRQEELKKQKWEQDNHNRQVRAARKAKKQL